MDSQTMNHTTTFDSVEQAKVERWGTYLLFFAVGLTIAHRLFLALWSDFPINDGALFLVFVEAVSRTFPALPADISYNHLTLPFAYPPLSFWIGAGLTKLGIPALSVVHYMPIAVSLAYVLVFALALRKNGQSKFFVAYALFYLLINVRAFEWLVMGGGMSRAAGAFFLVLALLATGIPAKNNHMGTPRRTQIIAGLAIGCAILSHLEWGLEATAMVILAQALNAKTVRDFIASIAVTGIVAALTILPWLAVVIGTHGIEPFFAASGSSRWSLATYIQVSFGFILTCMLNPLIPLGLYLSIRKRDVFWPLFLAICLVLTPRSGFTPAMLPLAVLSVTALYWICGKMGTRLQDTLLVIPALAIMFGSQINLGHIANSYHLRPLKKAELAAMEWAKNTQNDTPFLILSGLPWWQDRSAEWFPYVSGKVSLNTVQGREWMSDGSFVSWFNADAKLKRSENCKELQKAIAPFGKPQFIWTSWGSRCFLYQGYPIVFQNREVTIFKVPDGVSVTSAAASLPHSSAQIPDTR